MEGAAGPLGVIASAMFVGSFEVQRHAEALGVPITAFLS